MKRRIKVSPNKAREYEVKAARWLYEANIAAESGKKDKAEKLYAKSQFWHDKMNKALGRC
jgi:hypothetical protein